MSVHTLIIYIITSRHGSPMTWRLNIGARSCDCAQTGQSTFRERGGIASAPKAR